MTRCPNYDEAFAEGLVLDDIYFVHIRPDIEEFTYNWHLTVTN